MYMWKLTVITLVCFTFDTVCARTPGALTREALELRTMLQSALEQNRQLQDQNKRLKLIWSGLDRMCSTITPHVKCHCDKPGTTNTNPLVRQRQPGLHKEPTTRVRDPPPPSVEFYRQDNGKIVNSATYSLVKDKTKTDFRTLSKNRKKTKYTVSTSPIAEVLKDLNIAPFVDKSLRRKTPTTTPPAEHHIGLDLVHEMMGAHTHETKYTDMTVTGDASITALAMEELFGQTSTGDGHSHKAVDRHGHTSYNVHKDMKQASIDTRNHVVGFNLLQEVGGSTVPTNDGKGQPHTNHNTITDHGSPKVNYNPLNLDQTTNQPPFDLINKVNGHLLKQDKSHRSDQDLPMANRLLKSEAREIVLKSDKIQEPQSGLSRSSTARGKQLKQITSHYKEHALAPSNLNTKVVLNDLLLATEQSIMEKQSSGKRSIFEEIATASPMNVTEATLSKMIIPTDSSVVETLMFGTKPVNTVHNVDKIPRGLAASVSRTPTAQKELVDKSFVNDKQQSVARTTQAPKIVKKVKLAVKAVSSEGLVTNTISVTVRYTAPKDHTTEWLQLQENGATTRTSGVRIQKLGDPDSDFSSNMVFVDANSTRHALFRLFGNNKSISIQFNLTELQLSGEQILPDFMEDLINLNDTLMAPRTGDMVIDVEVRGSPNENLALRHTEIFFTGLNTTTRPPSVFEIVHFNSEGVSVLLTPRTQTTSNMKITLKRPYIDYGGILTVRLPQTVGGYLAGYFYGYMIRVLEYYTQEVIPFGHLGVYYLPKQTLVRDPSQSILCAAMGNPPPNVVILKVSPDGKEKETLTETIMLDAVTNMKSLTLYADKPDTSEGRYVCRASIGSEVIDSTTEVMVVQSPEFDDIQTGVTSNTTYRVTISCKATGKPRPRLEMRLYEEHGPNLAKTGIYKTSLLTPKDNTSQLTLSVSPNDREIHTVFCAAKQNIPDSKEQFRKIIVFPNSDDYTNWYLYNRLQNMATGW